MATSSKTQTRIHFAVDKTKLDLVNKLKSKIEDIFDVELGCEENTKNFDNLWIFVKGTNCDCQNTKEYVIGLCSPEDKVKVKCPYEDERLRFEIFIGIEKNTRAVIQICENDIIEISGSVLAVTLAVSSLEELLGPESVQVKESGKTGGKDRLDHVLRETISHNKDCNIDDYEVESIPSNVKRAMIDSMILDTTLDQIHDSDLFEDGATGGKTNVKTSYAKGLNPAAENATPETSNEDRHVILSSNGEQVIRKQGTGDNFAEVCEIAASVGYSRIEIEEGLLYVKNSTKPTEFLSMLKEIRQQKKNLGLIVDDNNQPDDRVEDILNYSYEPGQESVIECMESSDDNDVIYVGVTPPKPAEENAQAKQTVAAKAEDDQLQLKLQYEEQQKQASKCERSERNDDSEQTHVMSVWNGDQSSSKKSHTSNETSFVKESTSTRNEPNRSRVLNTHIENRQNVSRQKPNRFAVDTKSVPQPSNDRIPQNFAAKAVQPPNIPLPGPLIETLAENRPKKCGDPRYVVVDGSNVARGHGNGVIFSCLGIKLCVDYFLKRGHKKITVFVPGWRQKRGTYQNPIKDQEILLDLKKDGYLAFTPHRQLPSGQKVASYDDRFILELADKEDGVIVSNDQYRDFFNDKASYRKILEERCIPFVFVGDNFMPPEDPYGQNGPMLDDILIKPEKRRVDYAHHQSHQQQNYYQQQQQRPEYNMYPQQQNYQFGQDNYQQHALGGYFRRDNARSQTERIQRPVNHNADRRPNYSAPLFRQKAADVTDGVNKPYLRSNTETTELILRLKDIFSEKEQEEKINDVLKNHPAEKDFNKLTNYCLNAMVM
ncbi:NEDD4-binding protein 1 [Patella vulgata]|uniref:NEDD4-binding protein 1 n=1 Tax=Patella vulgata TaxID=6465 RepID=UPI0024A8E5A9|nr:NEDD4-binding protein 1 [Patella vulgata]